MQSDNTNLIPELQQQLQESKRLLAANDAAAEGVALQVLQQAAKISSDEYMAYAYCCLSAISHEQKFDDHKALEYARLAVQHTTHFKPSFVRITALYQLALTYQFMHQYVDCISTLHECLRMFEFYDLNSDEYDTLKQGVNYTLGIGYINIGLYGLSKNYLQTALEYSVKMQNEVLVRRCRITLANLFKYSTEHDKALEQYNSIIDATATQVDDDQVALVYDYIGQIYAEKQEYEKAEKYFLDAIAMRERIGNELRTIYTYFSYARMLFIMKKIEEAHVYFDKVKDILTRRADRFDEQLTNDIYYEMYAAMGDYEKAYSYFKNMELALVGREVMENTLKNVFEGERMKQAHVKEQADQLAKLNEEMNSYAKQLELSNKDLKTYAHTTSHDLREPLRMVSTYMTILEAKLKDKLNEEEKVFLRFAVDGSKRMDEMISRILDSAKGNKSVKPIDLNKLVETVKQNLTRLINDKKAEVIVQGTLPMVIADDIQMMQVFQNLVTNAIKYNNSKVPQITISSEQSADTVTLSIADNGVGIPEDKRSSVFEMFTRVENASGADGTGIGLSTVKGIVEKMKGRIWIEGNEPHGTIFKIQIPAPKL